MGEALQDEVRTTTEEESEGEIIAERFVIDGAEIGIKLGSDNIAWGKGVTPLGTDMGGEHMGEILAELRREGRKEGGTVEGTEVMGPDRGGKDTQLTEEIGTEHEGGSQTIFERPGIARLLPASKAQGLDRQTVKHRGIGVPPQAKTQGGIV